MREEERLREELKESVGRANRFDLMDGNLERAVDISIRHSVKRLGRENDYKIGMRAKSS